MQLDLLSTVKPVVSDNPDVRLVFLSCADVDANLGAIAAALESGDVTEVVVTCLGRHIAQLRRPELRVEPQAAIADRHTNVRRLARDVLRSGGDRILLFTPNWAMVLIPLKAVLEL